MRQNQFMLRSHWVTRVMENDTDKSTLECQVSRDGIMAINIHLHILKKMIDTVTELQTGKSRGKRRISQCPFVYALNLK